MTQQPIAILNIYSLEVLENLRSSKIEFHVFQIWRSIEMLLRTIFSELQILCLQSTFQFIVCPIVLNYLIETRTNTH